MGSAVAGVVLFVVGITLFNAARKKEAEYLTTQLLGQETQAKKEDSKRELLLTNINEKLPDSQSHRDVSNIAATQSNFQEPSTMPNIEILAEAEVTKENLAQLFKRAFFSTSSGSDGNLIVQSESVRIIVGIDVEKKLLVFTVMFRIKEAAAENAKLNLINNLNHKVILARFCIPRPNLMIADCTLPFEEGIPTFQVVATLRLFSRVIIAAIRAYDEHDVVF